MKLHKLRYILFDESSNIFDERSDRLKISSESIARCLKCLPDLIQFECPENLLSGALQLLHSEGVELKNIKNLHLKGMETNGATYKQALQVCPSIEELFLSINTNQEANVSAVLSKFKCIQFAHVLFIIIAGTSFFLILVQQHSSSG